MKKKTKLICIVLALALTAAFFAGCGIKYESKTIPEGTVGIFYSQDIADAEGGENDVFSYALAAGSTLPKGLNIEDGMISGVPGEAVGNHSFAVVATAGGNRKEAKYSITIKRGAIIYEDAVCEVISGQENSGTVALAVNAANITYTAVDGLESFNSTFAEKLSIRPDGTIAGTYTGAKNSRFPLTVTASADDCEPATAEIMVRVVNPYLSYEGRTLADARQGIAYAASAAYVEGLENNIGVTYRLASGSILPAGLTLAANGLITGVPTTVARAVPFTIEASLSGYSTTSARFSIDVVIDHQVNTASKIVNFYKDNVTELENSYDGTYYVNQSGVAGNAAALNNNNISYRFATPADESAFPKGFILYSNGAIFGASSERKTYTFDIIASAAGCADVIQTFSFSVKGSKIIYDSINGLLTRGEACNYNIATARATDADIKYRMTESDAAALLNNHGLTVSEDGKVTGTPKVSVKKMNFNVTAEAEDFTSATTTIYFRVQEPLTTATTFEAEYTNLVGKVGTGYSGAPTEEAMITANSGASNGHFVNYMHNNAITLEFVVWADAASSAALTIKLGSELNNITLTPSVFGVYVYDSADITTGNKTTLNYGSVSVSGGYQAYTTFQDVSFGNISLVSGYNTIQLAVHSNTFKDGVTGGPGVDAIKLSASAAIKWHPCLYNIG